MNYKSNSHWFFSKEQVLKHYSLGIELKLEVAYRRASAAFIQDVGIRLKMPQLTIATAISYFHRFFIRHQLKDHDRFVVATACLFLAGKVEETPRKLDDVIKVSHMIKNKKKGPEGDKMVAITQQEHSTLKNKILQNEHLILTTIAFELAVEHPYKYLLEYMKSIQGSKNLCQVAWNFVNDSLRTSLCLHYPPDLISYASIYLATRFLNYQLVTENKKEWWEMLGIKFEVLEDISKQILDLYEANPFQQTTAPSSTTTSISTSISTSTSTTSNENSNNSNNNATTITTITSTSTSTSSAAINEKTPLNETGDINKTPNKSLSTANSISHHISPTSSNNNNNNTLNPSHSKSSSTNGNSDHRYSPYKSSHHSNSNKRSLSRSPSPNRAAISN
ncbi:hypothetical protein RB653_000166 [Dictyostelium firmibasis]|uniref:Cyclin-like domain-containing protein n=1 Tax=Dictyostelium firmibasis TaxID=79012 RepID=A0AAN7U5M2_9MYCE